MLIGSTRCQNAGSISDYWRGYGAREMRKRYHMTDILQQLESSLRLLMFLPSCAAKAFGVTDFVNPNDTDEPIPQVFYFS